MWVAVFLALLFQTVLPLVTPLARILDLPLLITVYFSIARQNKIFGTWFGTFIGILQDALSHGYLGMMGMAKAVAGYLAASAGIKFNFESLIARGLLTGILVVIHDLCVFAIRHALLESPLPFRPISLASGALVNISAALVIYQLLDHFKRQS